MNPKSHSNFLYVWAMSLTVMGPGVFLELNYSEFWMLRGNHKDAAPVGWSNFHEWQPNIIKCLCHKTNAFFSPWFHN